MSLSKQLLILISALFLMIFSVNFVLSFNNIKSYLEGEAEVHAQDTATSLGVSLSPYMVDVTDPTIETTMKAIFDMGYYQKITLVDVEDKPLVTLQNNQQVEGVPAWFINAVSMKSAVAQSEISSGWSIAGVVSVSLNPGYAYLKLYEQALNSFYYSLGAFVLSITLLLLVLRVTLSSLKKIDKMALTIASGKFETINELPWTTEVRNVTTSMNKMSSKIEGVINGLNNKLNGIGKKLQQDDLTGLNKKNSFEIEMKKLFISDSDVDAFIFLIKIDALSSLVKELGSEEIDLFIKDFAKVLSDLSEQETTGYISVYRFFGSEFCLLIQYVDQNQAEEIAKFLSDAFTIVAKKYQKTDIVHIGVAQYDPLGSTASILLAANEAYEQAQLIGSNSYYIRKGVNRAKDIAEWKALVFDVIDREAYSVSYVGEVNDFQSGKILMSDAFMQAVDKHGNAVAIGTFISIAEKFSKIIDLDKGVITQVVETIKTEKIQHAVAISISARTLKNSDFRVWLSHVIKKNKGLSRQLVFSISSYAVAKEVEVYKEFIEFIHGLNALVMIKRFETQSMSPEVAKELNPDYIRLARDLGNGVVNEEGKQVFIESMQGVGELLDISILAENVQSDQDFEFIKRIGIVGASR